MSEKPINNMRLCFLDTETSGLTPDDGSLPEYRVIEISFVVTDPWPSMKIHGECHTKLRLSAEDLAKASPEALAVNGYSEEAWADAEDSSVDFWYKVHQVTAGTILVCQNVPFDRSFVYAEMKRHALKPQWQRRCIEMMTHCERLARERNILDPKKGELTWGLAQVYEAMGFPKLPEHSARPDVLRMMVIYQHMQRRLDLTIE